MPCCTIAATTCRGSAASNGRGLRIGLMGIPAVCWWLPKNDFAHQGLSAQFFDHSVERTYYAVVYGIPRPAAGIVCGNIARSRFDRKNGGGGKRRQDGRNHYQCLKSLGDAVGLIKCNLETGRTHQIRVHMASTGCHLVGIRYMSNQGNADPGVNAGG